MPDIRYDGGTYPLAGDLPEVGGSAPDFSLVSVELHDVSLSNWRGQRKILNIMPSVELKVPALSVQRFHERLSESDDVVLFVVSTDSPFALRGFLARERLADVVGLSAIRSAGFDRNYGVGITAGPMKGFYGRAVVVIDENDTIVHTEHLADVDDEPDYRAALRALGVDTEPR